MGSLLNQLRQRLADEPVVAECPIDPATLEEQQDPSPVCAPDEFSRDNFT